MNWHAFSARALQEGLADWFLLTTWCFSDALEKPHEVDDSWICQIQTAVQWIQYSRDALFHALDNLPDLECLMPGPLYTGKDGFSRERWGFWESRFRELAVDERLSKEIMSMCHEAAKQMAETSGINGVGEQGVEEPTQPENQ